MVSVRLCNALFGHVLVGWDVHKLARTTGIEVDCFMTEEEGEKEKDRKIERQRKGDKHKTRKKCSAVTFRLLEIRLFHHLF